VTVATPLIWVAGPQVIIVLPESLRMSAMIPTANTETFIKPGHR